MDLAELIRLAITGSVLMLVFALGLRATAEEATYLLRRPSQLVRALVAMYVIVPTAATLLAWTFDFRRPVEIALLATAVSPVPPILPNRQMKLGGGAGYAYGLLVAMALFAIATVPASVWILGWIFGGGAHVDVAEVAKLVGLTVLAPLAAGVLVRRTSPGFAERAGPPLSKVGTVLLAAGLLPVLVKAAPGMWALLGNGTVVAIATVVGAAVAAGHWLGGADPRERTALAIASATRHPGVALAICRLNLADQTLVPAAVLVFVLQAAIVTSLYAALVKRSKQKLP